MKVNASDWTTPKPQEFETAATNSEFEPGYIGPHTIGAFAPVSFKN
jgi:hypothetical protein